MKLFSMGAPLALAVCYALLSRFFVALVEGKGLHQAHAKPGEPYKLVDWDGNGQEEVTFDATESHSHYFDGMSGA